MAGSIKWTATFIGEVSNLRAQLYDEKGDIVHSLLVPCNPPVGCPFPMEEIGYGTYSAALSNENIRYYYNINEAVVTIPNNAAQATPVVLSSSDPDVEITIVVHV